jgi:hypothetical protein
MKILKEKNISEKIIGFVSDNASTVSSPINGVCGKIKQNTPFLLFTTDYGKKIYNQILINNN